MQDEPDLPWRAALPISTALHYWYYLWRRVVTRFWYAHQFCHVGKQSAFFPFGMLAGAENVRVGDRTKIRYGCRLETVQHGQHWRPRLEIGSDVNIEQNVHIVCHDRIVIGDRVSITGHCAIVDITHPYRVSDGVKMGSLIAAERSFVEIGEGTFIGFGATILPNVRIGRHCLIGAGSVVTRDIPDYSIAAGAPARVVRRATDEEMSRP